MQSRISSQKCGVDGGFQRPLPNDILMSDRYPPTRQSGATMSGPSKPERNPVSAETTFDFEGTCARFESECIVGDGGDGGDLESYLKDVRTDERASLLVRLLRIELQCRRRRGERPLLEEYHRRFPSEGLLVAKAFAGTESQLSRALGDTRDAPVSHLSVTTDGPPPGDQAEDVPVQIGDYVIAGELDRGGMGLILRGHDPDLDRELAFKVLRSSLQDKPEAVRRFVFEAQITGQLQHPGIAPVHELGRCDDGRPYFSMKLVRGYTLEKLLQERSSPTQDLPRFLKIFEQICQTVAFAHSCSVIHRDLKPRNVMVGAFGELHIMDWGLASRVNSDEDAERVPTDSRPDSSATTSSEIDVEQTVPIDLPDFDHLRLTRQGQVVGTYPYVPPEQARGEVEHMDERSDVFGLGAILCEILTGDPPYTGESSSEIIEKARSGDVAQALSRLDLCGADPQLITLARLCLAPNWKERPGDGQVVADIVTNYLVDQQYFSTRRQIESAITYERAGLVREYRRTFAAVCILVVLPLVLGVLFLLFSNLPSYFGKLISQ